MSIRGKLRITETGYAAWCPGCEEYHTIDSSWSFNGNFDAPTFTPSLLVQGDIQCHSYIVAGVWQFLSDCTHALANQKIPMQNEEDL